MHTPRVSHLQAVERILRYLKTSPGQGLVYKSSSSLSLIAYSNADCAGSLDDRRSTIGFCTYFGGNLITWRSKKQTVVARSSAEAEYRAMAAVTSELTWLGSLLGDLGVKLSSPPTLFCDSQAAIHIAKNLVFHKRTKHIEVDCHFVREKVQSKELMLEHVPASGQVVDVLTKALSCKLYYQFLSKLGAYDLYAPACGGVLDDIGKTIAVCRQSRFFGVPDIKSAWIPWTITGEEACDAPSSSYPHKHCCSPYLTKPVA
ncbi:hypothetical protein KSP39_PZI015550 [Platanthera zijinensis]|uniref:Uncharacterized protein n=1 Tax=Platanthera zijinensis TaxID=2320716 RepID=A0AAP0G1X5_9ASPA